MTSGDRYFNGKTSIFHSMLFQMDIAHSQPGFGTYYIS